MRPQQGSGHAAKCEDGASLLMVGGDRTRPGRQACQAMQQERDRVCR